MSEIFVFGSNLAGRHGKGAAKDARDLWGAEYGVGCGPTGSAYAIPTKDAELNSLPLAVIEGHLVNFLEYAKGNPKHTFQLTPIGCGLAGHSKRDIWAIMRKCGVSENVYLTSTWVAG